MSVISILRDLVAELEVITDRVQDYFKKIDKQEHVDKMDELTAVAVSTLLTITVGTLESTTSAARAMLSILEHHQK